MILKQSFPHTDFQFQWLFVLFDIFFRFWDLVLLGMHDKLAYFEIIGVSFTFNAGVSSEEFDI